MADPTNNETPRQKLKNLLGREPEVERLKTGKFIAKYVEYGMSPSLLVAETEEGAIEKLLSHLVTKNPRKQS
ncbi:MAG: hypothetical protein EBV30_10555 [Actinobacteria bacterium]|nr:hypothetical protein [Actinomycetota bacterium]NBO55886.1 hypothetical protein [Actinomycetota bacterium]